MRFFARVLIQCNPDVRSTVLSNNRRLYLLAITFTNTSVDEVDETVLKSEMHWISFLHEVGRVLQ